MERDKEELAKNKYAELEQCSTLTVRTLSGPSTYSPLMPLPRCCSHETEQQCGLLIHLCLQREERVQKQGQETERKRERREREKRETATESATVVRGNELGRAHAHTPHCGHRAQSTYTLTFATSYAQNLVVVSHQHLSTPHTTREHQSDRQRLVLLCLWRLVCFVFLVFFVLW